MSQGTSSSIVTPDARSVSKRRTARLRNSLLTTLTFSAIALVFILVRLHSSHPASSTIQSGTNTLNARHPTPDTRYSAFPTPDTQNLTQAIAQLRQRLQSKPGDLQSRIRLAALLDIQGDASDAEDVLRAGLQRGQRTPELYHALGTFYLHSKVYLPAAEAFYLETRLKPGDYLAHLQLATAYDYLGKADLARSQYEAARKINPSASEPYWGLALLNNTSQRYPYALQYLQEYFKRGGQPGMGYGLLCRIDLNMKQYAKAVEAGKKAAEALPDADSVWYNLGVAYADLPDAQSLPSAAQALERAVQLTPNWGDAHFELANVYSRLDRPADAGAQYREAIRCEPTRGKFYYQLGQLLTRQGQSSEGRQLLAKAQTLIPLNQRERQLQDQLAVTPNVPRLAFELALVDKQLGKYDLAQSRLNSVLQADPNYPQARAELASVRRLAAAAPRP